MKAPWWVRLGSELLRIRYRLLLVNALIVSVPIAGLGFARLYERESLRALEDDMVHQAEVLRALLGAEPGGPRLGERGPVLAAIAQRTQARLRLLDAQGNLVADSHAAGPPEGRSERAPVYFGRSTTPVPPEVPAAILTPEELRARPEIRRALAGQYGAETRIWRFEGGERVYLFSALPLRDRSGAVLGVVYVTRSTLPVLAALHRLRSTLFRVLVAALLATAVLSLFLAATIARPLSRLARIARRIADGDRRQSLALGRRDEIGHVARAFDAMARRLDERAQAAARLAADISHEFKSPLTSIRGAAELLLDVAADDPVARRRFLGNILEDGKRLDRLVSRLLELSRLEADEAAFASVDLPKLLDEVIAQQGPGGVEVQLEYRASRRALEGRAGQLGSALRNLLDNARQHASAGSVVTVRVEDGEDGEDDEDRVRIAVHNHGEPIGPANLARIWDRFFTTRAASGGSGLGLPIVAAAVAAHGGRTSVRSQPGEGTTFALELPAGRA